MIRLAAALSYFALVAFAVASQSVGSVTHRSAHPSIAVCTVFGKHCLEALKIVDCETGGSFSTHARNGQYLGLLQLGAWERRHFAHGRYTTAWDQARAGYRYFTASGYDWSPWSCRPERA